MTQVIIYTDPADNSLAVCVPTGAQPIESVRSKDIPNGVISEIVDGSRLPSDRLFRNAWTWPGVGQAVVEDLAKSKVIALDSIKRTALFASARAEELEAIFETPVHSSANIRQAYQECKGTINSASTIEELKHCLNNFTTTYSV